MSLAPVPQFLGTTELLIIVGVIVLLFGASKLPELARGSGRALRIFKAETKGLMDDDQPEDRREFDSRRDDVHRDDVHRDDVRRDDVHRDDLHREQSARRSDEPGPGTTA